MNAVGCLEECDSPKGPTAGDGTARDLTATGGPSAFGSEEIFLVAVEDEEQFEKGVFAAALGTAANANPGALALLTLSTLVLLVGLVGGLRAVHGQLRQGYRE